MNGTPLHLQHGPPWRLQIKYHHGLGDAIALTAAVESLHRTYPGEYMTAVDATFPEVFHHNPRVTQLPGYLCHIVNMGHPPRGPRLTDWLCDDLGVRIGRTIPVASGPVAYLTPEESVKPYPDLGPYIVVNASRQDCLTAKYSGAAFWQEVTHQLRGVVSVVQVGGGNGHHPGLTGAVDLVGRTTLRDLFQLVHHAEAATGPESYLNHLSAAVNTPYVCVAGGRCDPSFPAYPTTTVMTSVGKLDCCRTGGCWRSRTVTLGDGTPNDRDVCVLPMIDQGGEFVPKCLTLIDPADVAWELAKLVMG